ncbi:MAG: SNF2-related protein [Planctomycetota bacterium]
MSSGWLEEHGENVLPRLRKRGAELWRSGAVALRTPGRGTWSASVADTGRTFVAELRDVTDPAGAWLACDCGADEHVGICEHLWAALLAIEAAGKKAAPTPRPVVEKAATADEDGDELAGDAAFDDLPAPRGAGAPAAPRSAPSGLPVARGGSVAGGSSGVGAAAGDWRQRVSSVTAAAAGAIEPAPPMPVVEYHVATPTLVSEPGFTLRVVLRPKKQDGTLGVPRTTQLRQKQIALLPAVDRDLLQRMLRDRNFALGFYAAEFGTADLELAAPWRVSPRLVPEVLDLLRSTERLYLDLPDGSSKPLYCDHSEPFRFELSRVPAPQGAASVILRGAFRRGQETLSLVDVLDLDHGVVVRGDRLLRIDTCGADDLVRDLRTRGPMVVPQGELAEMLATMSAVPGSAQFLAPLMAEQELGKPIAVVPLTWPKDPNATELLAQLQFDYGGELIAADEPKPLVPAGGLLLRRDPEPEAAAAALLLEVGLRSIGPPGTRGHYAFLREELANVVKALSSRGVRVLARGQRVRNFETAHTQVASAIDWFSVDGQLTFAGATASLPELLRRKATPEGFVELGDGSFGVLPQQWLRRLDTLRAMGATAASGDDASEGQEGNGAEPVPTIGALRVPNTRALLLDALLTELEETQVDVDERFAVMQQRAASFRSAQPAAAPPGFRGQLRPYQQQGLGWLHFLRDFGLGGCLADDMGLGKTVQVLALLAGEHGPGGGAEAPSLLVAPRSLVGNWAAEAAKFAPGLAVLDFSTGDRWEVHGRERLAKAQLVLTTYGSLRNDAPRFAELGQRFHHVVLDEAHAVKNSNSQNAKAVRLLAARHRLALSGTPVENHFGELWSLFEFLNPGMLGQLAGFRTLFGKGTAKEASAESRALVQKALRPVLLRRTKAQVLHELPAKVEQTLFCTLEGTAAQRYAQLAEHFRTLVAGGVGFDGKQNFVLLQGLLRLRQAACHEGLIDPQRSGESSAKLDVLLPALEQIAEEGHKALVFSQFTTLLDLIEPHLQARGLVYERLDGSTQNRPARVKRFTSDPDCKVFLISLKAGGTGLNLVAASYVFLLDPWWNPAAELQAIDRAHRMGQQRTVHAYRIVTKGTIEERVLELQAQKKQLTEAVLGDDRSLLQDLSKDDLALLLG